MKIPITVLLIDDQAIIAEAVKRMLEREVDIHFHFCSDSTKALDFALLVKPTVILQDLIMPGIEGLTLLTHFRKHPQTKEIPIIILSTKEDPQMKAEAFFLGANDYLVKLPSSIELIARIRYHSNGYIRLLERNEAYRQLEESQQQLRHELSEAAHYVASVLPPPLQERITTDWRFIPSTSLGGDIFGYHWIDKHHFSMYLLDVCGHGVGAALLSISIANVLRMQNVLPIDFLDPSSVLTALNKNFPMEQHNEMFFSIWYGVYNQETRELCYSSGGHPPAILLNKRNGTVQIEQLKPPGAVIGVLAETPYVNAKTVLDKESILFLFSDGVYEIVQKDGSLFHLPEFIDLLKKKAFIDSFTLDYIIQMIQDRQGRTTFVDDFSLLEITFH